MALAHLEIEDDQNNNVQCKVDIGKNKYFQFVTGEGMYSNKGLPAIENVKSTSKLYGPLEEEELGRKTVTVPQTLFDKQNNRIQLISYKDKDKKGIAFSDVLTVTANNSMIAKTSAFSFSNNSHMQQANFSPPIRYYNTSFSIQENRMSDAMFFGSILPALGGVVKGLLPTLIQNAPAIMAPFTGGGSILPGLLSAAPQILGALSGGANGAQAGTQVASGGAPNNPLLQLLNSPEITTLLQNLLKQTLNGSNATPAAEKAKSLQLQLPRNRYSEAKFAPALLAALPALMPLLQQVLSPETIGKVLDQPQKMLGAVTDSVAKLGELGIASHEQDLQHLRALNPGTGPAVDSLLESMSMSIREQKKLIAYKLLKTVKIKFKNVVTVDCEGKNSVVYSYGATLAFPIDIETPKAIGNCMVQLSVKDVKTSEILLIKNFRYQTAAAVGGTYPLLSPEDYKGLASNNDYLLSVSLIFKNKKKENVGAYMSEVIHFSNSHLFASIKGRGPGIPLNDVQLHRAFWHKIWQTKFSKEVLRVKIQLKYYYVLTDQKEGVGRMETVTKPVKSEDKFEQSMFMKSGVKINMEDLNKLIPQISGNKMLSEDQLKALKTPGFLSSYNTMAQDVIKVNGFENEICMLWAFPELSFHDVVLKKISKTNELGMVTELSDDTVQFPLPVSLYCIAAKNK
jgi:hypothetical protein